MSAPSWERFQLTGVGTGGSGDSFTGTLPFDAAGGFSISPGRVRIFRSSATGLSANTGWAQTHWVGEDNGSGGIRGAGSFVAGDLTGVINYSTGEITVTENGTDVFTTVYDYCWVEYLQEHDTVSSDWDLLYHSNSYPVPIISKYPHSSLANPVSNHGVHCLSLLSVHNNSNGGMMALLNDAAHLTAKAVMTQMICRSTDLTYAMPFMVQRAETLWHAGLGAAGSRIHSLTLQNISTQTRMIFGNALGPVENGPEGSIDFAALAPAEAYVSLAVDPALDDTWMVWRMISTLEAGAVHTQILVAIGATEADKVSPTFQNWGHIWHEPGVATPVTQNGDFGAHVKTTWQDSGSTQPPGVLSPGRAGFAMNCWQSPGKRIFVDSFKSFVMP